MNERNRLLLLIAIMTSISLIVGGIAVSLLYLTSIEQEKARLVETAQSQARLIEAIARATIAHEREDPNSISSNAETITLQQVADAHEHYQGFGETGEFVLSKRVGSNIVFLLRHRHSDLDFPKPIPFDGTAAEPTRRALSGKSGIMIGPDYRGVTVLAAYEPVSELNFGIVAKIDHKEILAPFFQAALEGMLIATILIIFGAWIFFRITNPIIRSLAEHKDNLEKKVEERTMALITSNDQLEKEIIERKKAELKFRGILESVPDAMVIIDEQGSIRLINKETEQFFGYSRNELIGKTIEILVPERFRKSHTNHRGAYFEQPSVRPMGINLELYALHKDGREIPVEISLGPIPAEGENLISSTIRDITLRKEAEKQLQDAKEASESANQAKTQFLTNMSHEIRTPLNAIVGFSQILLNREKSLALPEDISEYLKNLKLSGQNLSELINNILDLAKIEAGKMTMSQEALDLPLLVQGIYHINRAQALQKHIDFSYNLDPQLPNIIALDRTKLNQILMNLTGNAIKFTPERKKVVLSAFKEEDWLVFEVTDEGIGIPEDQQETIFNAFEQLDASVTRHFSGTGLGLAISRQMVQMLGGTIDVRSVLGSGSTFRVRLPLMESVFEKSISSAEEWDELFFSKENQIVVVEDNTMNQKMMKALFADLSLKIHLADNGEEGIRKVQTLKSEGRVPDLILMDMHMPGMDGISATHQIRMDPECRYIPIIALSAEAFHSQQEEAFQSGVTDYLTKPLELEKLIPLLKKYLRQDNPMVGKPIKSKKGQKILPAEVQDQILEEFKILAEIPPFLSNEVVKQTKKMIVLCQPYDSPFLRPLKQIEQAVFSRNSNQIATLINEVLHGEHPNR
ncbi:MAG: PAS domain S-box protein [SAR324 cluster bacterium]|nr:PAS domain S-box protein [SAR324 cluster bacterium]